ncbi:unnamed protein product [Brugia timori]|uniref:Uncharacterized protein n=1 Tax=Brugia timori TaxID=42155 RepID=A0A3P7XXR5_9BILA|nr:unnamed protein product [Brugia timori]
MYLNASNAFYGCIEDRCNASSSLPAILWPYKA